MAEWPDDDTLQRLSTWLDPSSPGVTRALLHEYRITPTAHALPHPAPAQIALQFPDHLLPHAPLVCDALRLYTTTLHPTPPNFFLLGDTSYGQCCVDEVAAQHLSADLVIHYGDACLSPTRSLPALHVFPLTPLPSVRALPAALHHVLNTPDVRRVVVLYDLHLHPHVRDLPLPDCLHGKQVCLAAPRHGSDLQLVPPGPPPLLPDGHPPPLGPLVYPPSEVPLAHTAFLYLTATPCEAPPAARHAALLLSTGPDAHCASFHLAALSSDAPPEALDASRLLRRRLAPLGKAAVAQRVGILAGTLGVSGNVAVIERLKRVVERAGRRAYVILVGKPNPAKLANFAEIDVFVLVACAQNALLEGREYMRPVVTPLELEAALERGGDVFGQRYSLDFRDLLAEKEKEGGGEGEGEEKKGEEGLLSVAVRGDLKVAVRGPGGGAEFLAGRMWQGLSFEEGKDGTKAGELAVKAVMGQTGVASRYEGEGRRAADDGRGG